MKLFFVSILISIQSLYAQSPTLNDSLFTFHITLVTTGAPPNDTLAVVKLQIGFNTCFQIFDISRTNIAQHPYTQISARSNYIFQNLYLDNPAVITLYNDFKRFFLRTLSHRICN